MSHENRDRPRETLASEYGGRAVVRDLVVTDAVQLPASFNPGGGGGSSTVGATGAGTLADPLVLNLGGPFDPLDTFYVFEDFGANVRNVLSNSTAFTTPWGEIALLFGGGVFSGNVGINSAAGPLGPGNGSMLGVLNLTFNGQSAGAWLSATQFRVGDNSGLGVRLDKLVGDWDVWTAIRVSFESADTAADGTEKVWVGLYSRFDSPAFADDEGAFFTPVINGDGNAEWYCRTKMSDENGGVDTTVASGVRVGRTTAHPLDSRAAQTLVVRVKPHAMTVGEVTTNTTVSFYIDGLLVHSVELKNPTMQFVNVVAQHCINLTFNTTYIDFMGLYVKGRPR